MLIILFEGSLTLHLSVTIIHQDFTMFMLRSSELSDMRPELCAY